MIKELNFETDLILFNVKIQKTPLEQVLKKIANSYLQFKFETELLGYLQDKNKAIVFIHVFNQKTLTNCVQFLKIMRSYIKKNQLLVVAINEMIIPEIEKRLLQAGVHEFIDFFASEKAMIHKLSMWQKHLASYSTALVNGKEELIQIKGAPRGLGFEEKLEKLPIKALLARKTQEHVYTPSKGIEVHLNGKEIDFILEDQDEQVLVFKSKKNLQRAWVNPSMIGPTSLYLKYEHNKESRDLKIKGRLSDIQRTEEGLEYFLVAYSHDAREDVDKFIQGYQGQQKDINLFIDIMKGN
jgi:hypothetical protein